MIFAHGFGCDQNMWRLVTPAFENDFKIVLFDYVGAGRSDLAAYDRDRYASLDGYADDVIDICDELALGDAIFVGHSVSSMVGVLVAKKRPDLIAALVMIGPSPRYIDEGDYKGGFTREAVEKLLEFLGSNHLGWSAAMAPVIMGNPERPELGSELANSFCSTDPEIARQFARVTFLSDNRADLAGITIPTLVLQCCEDVIAPVSVGQYCKDNLANSKLTVMNATGHCPHLSEPDETVAAIKEFLLDLP